MDRKFVNPSTERTTDLHCEKKGEPSQQSFKKKDCPTDDSLKG
jgi:hypothetical protein